MEEEYYDDEFDYYDEQYEEKCYAADMKRKEMIEEREFWKQFD